MNRRSAPWGKLYTELTANCRRRTAGKEGYAIFASMDDALAHGSGAELSRVRSELRIVAPEAVNQEWLEWRTADVVMQARREFCREVMRVTALLVRMD